MMIPLILACAYGQTPLVPPTPPAGTKVVLTVNGHQILAREIQAYLWDWNAVQVGQALTLIELIREEAARVGVAITDAEIKQRVDAEMIQASARMNRAIQQGPPPKIPKSQLELSARAQLLLQKIADKLFIPKDYVKVSTLVIRPKTESADDLKAALAKADLATAALAKGDAWEKVFPAYATDPQATRDNGELGWVKVSDFPATTQTELAALKTNGTTKPVQTPNGIQIFKYEGRLSDAPASEVTAAKARYLQISEQEIVQRLQKAAKITTSY